MAEQAIVSKFVSDDEERVQEVDKKQAKKNKDKEEEEEEEDKVQKSKNESDNGKSNITSKNLQHAENGDLNESRKRKNSGEDVSIFCLDL